jgi:hypothetical protein
VATTVTLNTIMERLVSAMWGPRNVVHPASLSSTATTATSLVIDAGPGLGLDDYTYSSGSVNAYDGASAYLTVNHSTQYAPQGEFAGHVTRGGYTGSSATLGLSSGFSTTPILVTGTATGTQSATTLKDTSKTWTVDQFAGGYVRTIAGTGSGQLRQIVSNTVDTLTVATWTTTPVAASTTYAIFPNGKLLFMNGLEPHDFLEAINNVTRTLYLPRFLPLSIIGDGDMELSDTSAYTAVGSPTLTKSTSFTLLGKYALKIVTTSTNEGAYGFQSATEGMPMHLSVPVTCTAGSLKVEAYDGTNSATIDSVTVDQSIYTQVRFDFTVPDNCEELRVRLLSQTATTTAYVDHVSVWTDNDVIDLSTSQALGPLDGHDIMGIYTQRTGFPSEANRSYEAWTQCLQQVAITGGTSDYYAGIPHWITTGRLTNAPFIEFRDKGTDFTSLAATTSEVSYVPIEIIVEGALAELKERLRNRTRSRTQKDTYNAEMHEHRRAYRGMLEALDLAKPVVQYMPARRVSA